MGNDEIQRSLRRLEGTLDSLISEIKHFEDDKKSFSSIDTRIQKVEKKICYASGFVACNRFYHPAIQVVHLS
jgi:hypothetical protein